MELACDWRSSIAALASSAVWGISIPALSPNSLAAFLISPALISSPLIVALSGKVTPVVLTLLARSSAWSRTSGGILKLTVPSGFLVIGCLPVWTNQLLQMFWSSGIKFPLASKNVCCSSPAASPVSAAASPVASASPIATASFKTSSWA